MKNKKLTEPVNIEYLKAHGSFKNNNEFKIYVQEFINENVKVNDIIANTIITREDIEYIKNKINQRIP